MKKKEELNIMANIKIIEELKANLLCIIGEFFSLLTRGTNVAKDSILNCIAGAILILYVLAQKLGYSCNEVDDELRKKLKLGIAEEHDYETKAQNLQVFININCSNYFYNNTVLFSILLFSKHNINCISSF